MINLLTFSYEIFLRRREDIPNIEKIGNLNMNSLGRIYDTWLVPLMGESNVLIQFFKFILMFHISLEKTSKLTRISQLGSHLSGPVIYYFIFIYTFYMHACYPAKSE